MFTSIQSAISYFSVFGGLDIDIDKNSTILNQIEKYILDDYSCLRHEISAVSKGDATINTLLSALAIGDEKLIPAMKKIKLSFDDGLNIAQKQCNNQILTQENPRYSIIGAKPDSGVSSKFTFTTPFIRFWFAFISPLYQGIKDKDYTEFYNKYSTNTTAIEATIFRKLSYELFKYTLKDERIVSIGRYWDRNISIDMIAKTKDGKVIVGDAIYTNSKAKKSDLNRLKDTASKLNINVDKFILFSKKGFDSELKSLRKENLHLLNTASFGLLLD
jgi:hypothetical protein